MFFAYLRPVLIAGSVVLGGVLISKTTTLLNICRHSLEVPKKRKRLQTVREEYPSYTYMPLGNLDLKTIRLIELLPDDDQKLGIPRLRLWTSSLLDSQQPSYEAVSYCWGDKTHPQPLLCENSIIWATQNLFDALQQMRLKDRTRILWADAICINQDDPLEKNWQTRMMADIYGDAEQVLAWLGGSKDHSELLETFIPQVLRAKELFEAASVSQDDLPLLSRDQQIQNTMRSASGFDPLAERAWALEAIT